MTIISGDLNIPCPGDPFIKPVGEKFVHKKDKKDEKEKYFDSESRNHNEDSKSIDLETSLKIIREHTQIDIASTDIDPEFSNAQGNTEEFQTYSNNQKVKRPQLVALDSTDKSLTWQLDGLDPKIKIDKYQVHQVAERFHLVILLCSRYRVGMI